MPKPKPTGTGEYILGKSMEEIRKAYFDGEVNKLCADVLAAGAANPEDVTKLGEVLKRLREEEETLRKGLTDQFGGKLFPGVDALPPRVEDLQVAMTEEQKQQYATWDAERIKAVNWTRETIKNTARVAMSKQVLDKTRLMNDAHGVTGCLLYISEDKNYKKMRLSERVINIIDEYGVSRREAQDRAEVTQEYLDYENAKDLELVANSFVMNAKKEFGGAGTY